MMIERLVKQRPVISDITLDQSVTKRSDAYMLLKESEWESLSSKIIFVDLIALSAAQRLNMQ